MKKPIIISLFNNKGGVGKSTIAVNLSSMLSNAFKVLLIDNDPQSNATSGLSEEVNQEMSTYNAYKEKITSFKKVDFGKITGALEGHEKKTGSKSKSLGPMQNRINAKNLYILPGSHKLNVIQEMLINQQDREKVLAKNLKDSLSDFDFVLIDNPPAINVLTWNSLYIADYVLIPFKPGKAELDGIDQLLETLKTVEEKLHHKTEILGVVINMYTKTKISEIFKNASESIFKDNVFSTKIKGFVMYMEATSLGMPVDMYGIKEDENEPEHEEVQLFADLAKEFLKKLKAKER
jgi:chromosome partitioning protein